MAPLTITTASDDIFTLDVELGEVTVGNLKVLLEAQSGTPVGAQLLLHNATPLADDAATLAGAGVGSGDLLLLMPRTAAAAGGGGGGRQAPRQAPAAQGGAVQDARQALALDPATGAPRDVAAFREAALREAGMMAQLRVDQPNLYQLLQSGDLAGLTEYFKKNHRLRTEAHRKRAELERRIAADPFDIEAQRELEDQIRQENVQENMENAMEFTPEVFGSVHMLYVDLEINGHPVKAFVDSGAQMTIMCKRRAEQVGLLRLMDTRFSGIARGVGQGKILGRVHMAPMSVSGHNMACSVTIMEQDDMDFLFGLDMLKRHQCSINLKNNQLEFGSVPGLSVPFLGEGDVPQSRRDIKVDGEDMPEGGASGTKRERDSDSGAGAEFPEAKIKALMDLGYAREQVIEALRAAQGNEEAAAAMLIGF
mmetsp:Transcript_20163/g.62480  ORF Transcript_20163/g.62480 Transcript_20163/m.62480 type:complete len:423 (-) Transcript_20163:608-1876(-)|eukprot:CAMPEP_0119164634 /NCGR_PEP_ID=MMETSP1315-20130426/4455_1 /TAXON_ID=676789 /ORGANISM="Prasinoderma singularis, Strain RCC927" /LENGTH=422 /DNA_ID=CAMNT_0007157817 /DNA_START=169 /DNA_END=1437 /DNA_ORIENTATION=-